MDFNIEVRKKQLQNLDQYITSSKDEVESILSYLGWNSKNLLEREEKISCSINPHHKIPPKSMAEHLKKCCLQSAKYNLDDLFLSEPVHDPTSSIKIDNAKKIEILGQARQSNQKFKAAWNGQDSDPMTADRLFSTFSTDERLMLYDYCVENTEPPPLPKEFNVNIDEKKEDKILTQEELLIKERDAKRRRIKYKSVHTSRNKSHTEVIKEVIENQMELYKEFLTRNMAGNINVSNINKNYDEDITLGNSCTNHEPVEYKQEKVEHVERPHSSVSRHSTYSNGSKTKKDPSNYYESHKNESEQKAKYLEYSKKYRHEDRSEYRSYKEKGKRRFRDYEENSKHYSRDKGDWHYKSERRH